MLTECYLHKTHTYWLSEKFRVSSFHTDMSSKSFRKPCTYAYCPTKTTTSRVKWLSHDPLADKHSKCCKSSCSHDGAAEDTRYSGIWRLVPWYSDFRRFERIQCIINILNRVPNGVASYSTHSPLKKKVILARNVLLNWNSELLMSAFTARSRGANWCLFDRASLIQ